MISYSCPQCGERLRVDDTHAGRAFVCGLCGQSSIVPSREQPVEPSGTAASGSRVYEWGAFVIGLAIPIVGLVYGLLRAFDDDAMRKRQAGYWLGGAAAGLFLAIILAILSPYLLAAWVFAHEASVTDAFHAPAPPAVHGPVIAGPTEG